MLTTDKYTYKTDLFSVGCVLYEMMILEHSFEAPCEGRTILKSVTQPNTEIKSNHSEKLKK
jgi:serine/threonine protein kinase